MGGGGKATPTEKAREGGDALGSCRHCIRIGMDSYQLPTVAYGAARKPPKSAQNMGPVCCDPSPRGSGRGRSAEKRTMGDALGSCAH